MNEIVSLNAVESIGFGHLPDSDSEPRISIQHVASYAKELIHAGYPYELVENAADCAVYGTQDEPSPERGFDALYELESRFPLISVRYSRQQQDN